MADRIVKAPGLDMHGSSVDVPSASRSQWGFAGLTAGDDISLSGVPLFYSIADLNADLPYPPEFAAFVMDPTRGNATKDYLLNYTTSRDDFNRDLTI